MADGGCPGSARVFVRHKDSLDEVCATWEHASLDLLGSPAPWRTFRWYRGQKHYSGTYWSSTEQAHVIYESRLELARLLFADFDPHVRRIIAQPFLFRAVSVRKPLTALGLIWAAAVTLCAPVEPALARADPAPAPSADSLIVGLTTVRQITGNPDLTPDDRSDLHRPTTRFDLSILTPACRPVLSQEAVFGTNWTQFRSVRYAGTDNYDVTQSVAIYGSDADATATLGRFATAASVCAAAHDPHAAFTVRKDDPGTITLCYDTCSDTYRVKNSVLAEVDVNHFPDAARIARRTLDTITAAGS